MGGFVGNHTIPAIIEDGITSNTVDVYFDIDFKNSTWSALVNDMGNGDIADDQYIKHVFNSDVSQIQSFFSPDNQVSWSAGASSAVTSYGNGSFTSHMNGTYSTFTTINDGIRNYSRQ